MAAPLTSMATPESTTTLMTAPSREKPKNQKRKKRSWRSKRKCKSKQSSLYGRHGRVTQPQCEKVINEVNMSITQITESEAIHISTNATQSSVTNKGSKISFYDEDLSARPSISSLCYVGPQDQLNMLDTMRTSKIKIEESVWIPQEYNLVEIFSKKSQHIAFSSLSTSSLDHVGRGSKSVHRSIYNLSERELSVLKSYIEDYLPKG